MKFSRATLSFTITVILFDFVSTNYGGSTAKVEDPNEVDSRKLLLVLRSRESSNPISTWEMTVENNTQLGNIGMTADIFHINDQCTVTITFVPTSLCNISQLHEGLNKKTNSTDLRRLRRQGRRQGRRTWSIVVVTVVVVLLLIVVNLAVLLLRRKCSAQKQSKSKSSPRLNCHPALREISSDAYTEVNSFHLYDDIRQSVMPHRYISLTPQNSNPLDYKSENNVQYLSLPRPGSRGSQPACTCIAKGRRSYITPVYTRTFSRRTVTKDTTVISGSYLTPIYSDHFPSMECNNDGSYLTAVYDGPPSNKKPKTDEDTAFHAASGKRVGERVRSNYGFDRMKKHKHQHVAKKTSLSSVTKPGISKTKTYET